MVTKKETITRKALEILKSSPDGVRYSDLLKKVGEEFPDIPGNTIQGTVWNLHLRLPDEVYKPARGLFRHTAFSDAEVSEKEQELITKTKEGDFYGPFANWLVSGLDECTKAIPLGGSTFKDKWGTPDVIGKREPLRSDIIKAPTEIVSAEIKTDTRDLITAFGQACSYRVFSHKSYIVVPKASSQDDISRLDALCRIFEIGLVLFDSNNASDPQFEIRVRPLKHEPDMFYVNKYMKFIEKDLFG